MTSDLLSTPNEELFAALKQCIKVKSINKNKNDHDLLLSLLKKSIALRKNKHIIKHTKHQTRNKNLFYFD